MLQEFRNPLAPLPINSLDTQDFNMYFKTLVFQNIITSIGIFLLAFSVSSQVEDPELSQFYHSDFEPIELNRDNFERLKTTYKEYIEANGNKRNFDEEKFVYEYNYFLDRINRSGNVFYGDEISAYVNSLKDKILLKNELDLSIQVYVTDYVDLNAFTNDFGNVYINIATIAKMNSELELMIILAHEIGHVILHHSREKEFYSKVITKNVDINEDESVFRIHSFSREKELEADSIALKLLDGIVTKRDFDGVFSNLEHSENPAISDPIDFSDLAPMNSKMFDFLVEMSQTDVQLPMPLDQKNDSLSTHPSIQSRIDFAEKHFEEKPSIDPSKFPYKSYNEVKHLSSKVLLNSYIENGAYIEALFLTLQLRNRLDSKYLLYKQSQIMTLLVQEKYSENFIDQIELNLACSDTNYMRFKQCIRSISKLDWNILTYDFHQNNEQLDKSTKDSREEWAFHFLYDNNSAIFESDSTGKISEYAVWDEELSATSWLSSVSESVEFLNIIDSLGFSKNLYAQAKDSSQLLKDFLNQRVLSEREQGFIETYKTRIDLRENNISTNGAIFLHPAWAAGLYHRGIFEKSKDFDPSKKTALIQSDNLFFESKDLRQYNFNYKKSLKLNSQLRDVSKRYNTFAADYSLSSGGNTSVLDNYLHKLIMTWIFENSESTELHYSRVEDEIQKYLLGENIDYIVYRLSILNRNRGSGRKFNLNYYELYFDVNSRGIVYVAKIGSKQFPDRFQIEQMVYLSELNKKAE